MIKMINSIEKEILNGIEKASSSLDKVIQSKANGSIKGSLLTGEISVKDYIDIKNLFNVISEYDVLVGIPQRNAKRPEGKIDNVELAYIHTHGVDKKSVRQKISQLRQQGMNFSGARKKAHQLYLMTHGSPAYRIPPRPIIEPAIEANMDKITKKLDKAMKAFLNFNIVEGEELLKKTGMFAQNKVRGWFTDPRNNWPPNSPATIKAKSKGKNIKDKPLIDTGELRKSITYVVVTPQSRLSKSMKTKSQIISKGNKLYDKIFKS